MSKWFFFKPDYSLNTKTATTFPVNITKKQSENKGKVLHFKDILWLKWKALTVCFKSMQKTSTTTATEM